MGELVFRNAVNPRLGKPIYSDLARGVYDGAGIAENSHMHHLALGILEKRDITGRGVGIGDGGAAVDLVRGIARERGA